MKLPFLKRAERRRHAPTVKEQVWGLIGQIAHQDQPLYQAWKEYCLSLGEAPIERSLSLILAALKRPISSPEKAVELFKEEQLRLGRYPHQRLRELILADLEKGGIKEVTIMKNPTDQSGTQGAPEKFFLPERAADKVLEAQAKISDAFTAVDIAEQMGRRLQEISSSYLAQIAQLTASMSEITGYMTEMEQKLAAAPDFKAWGEKMGEIIRGFSQITQQQEQIRESLRQLVEAQNHAPKLILGKLQEWLDRELLVRIGELIEINNRIVELLSSSSSIKRRVETGIVR